MPKKAPRLRPVLAPLGLLPLLLVLVSSAAAETHEPTPAEEPTTTEAPCVEDGGAIHTAPGLRVYVDPRTGELTSTPPPRSGRPALRILESQARPARGDVPRKIHVLPGIGLGVYVGDLFVHSMRAKPTPDEPASECRPALAEPSETATPPNPSTYPVAVQ